MRSRLLSLFSSTFLFLSTSAFAADTGTLIGKITFSGVPPAARARSVDSDPYCKAEHPTGITIQHDVVDSSGGLANVLVYVKEGLKGTRPVPSSAPVVLDQKGCVYHPTVFGIQTGQMLVIQNSDQTLHNVHAMASKNAEFNIAQPGGMKSEKKFDKPEVFVKFKCDVHDWMTAWAGVVDNPFFDVTKADGSFSIAGLPPGDYTIAAAHPKAGEQTVKMKVVAGQNKVVFKPFANRVLESSNLR